MAVNCGFPKNLGIRSCPDSFFSDLAFVLFTKRGENTAATLAAFNSALIVAAINNTSPDLRLLPVYEIEGNDPVQADPSIASYPSGRSQFIKDGVVTFSFQVVGGDGKTYEAFKSLNNGKYDAYFFDRKGGLLYRKDSDTTEDQVKPIAIAQGSILPSMIFANGSDRAEGVMVKFSFDQNIIRFDELTYKTSVDLGYNIGDIAIPLVTVANPVFASTTSTTTIATITDERGNPITLLTTANITSITVGGSSKTLSSIVESTTNTGVYTITWTTAGGAAEEVVIVWTGDGYDWYYANQITTTTPA